MSSGLSKAIYKPSKSTKVEITNELWPSSSGTNLMASTKVEITNELWPSDSPIINTNLQK